MTQIKRALISVSDKTNLVPFANSLIALGVEIISTGGTFKHLLQNGIKATEVSEYTGFPEIMDGRVKTLHPKIHGGILAIRDNNGHIKQMNEHDILGIDLVCVNLYPFSSTINSSDCTLNLAIENIDIGGPAMIRASAKNHKDVIILVNPNDYTTIIDKISNNQLDYSTRIDLAMKAFAHTAYYDSIISQYLLKQNTDKLQSVFPSQITISATLKQSLRYGENSHQQAAFYVDDGKVDGLLASFTQVQGKELSYNNLVDSDTAWECVKQFNIPSCVIVKHANPCGVAIADNLTDSYKKAFSCDPISSFGGIIAFNQPLDVITVTELVKQFVEVLIAPAYDNDALAVLATKPNIRVLEVKLTNNHNIFDYKRIGGGILVQTPELKILDHSELKLVSKREVSHHEKSDLELAWNIARFVKSNAIILVKNGQSIGIGAGQMSRIDSTKIAINKARQFGFIIDGCVCASDAFFPFRDNVDLLAKNGVCAIIQPGGSIKDTEIFNATNECGISMLLTGYRVFRH